MVGWLSCSDMLKLSSLLIQTVVLFLLFVVMDARIESRVVFEDGHDYFYTYSAVSDLMGLQNITTVIKIHIRHVNRTSDGDLNELLVDSFLQRTQDGRVANNPLKWKLSRPFLFERNDNGEITFVHYHDEDEIELVNLKKVLSSVFSVHVKMVPEKLWTYTVNETDHSGRKENKYFIERHNDDALTLKRFHHSNEQVEKRHKQVMHMLPSREVREINAFDQVVMENKFSSFEERKPDPDEYVIHDTVKGKIPVIQSSSNVKVIFTNKIPLVKESSGHENLKRDDILPREKPPRLFHLSNMTAEINDSMECIKRYEDKYATNRTECVHQLKESLKKLYPEDLVALGSDLLDRTCSEHDNRCQDDRYLIIDVMCQIATPGVQSLLVRRVLKRPHPNEEEVARILFQFVGLDQPNQDVVNAVRELCLGKDKRNHGFHNTSQQTHSACLTLGGLAKTISKTNKTLATEIVLELATWVGRHDGALHTGQRVRKSINVKNETEDDYVLSKMVLIEALGNTGHADALGHIISYAKPNAGHSSWRRSAINALRWYTCKESASVLMDTALNDRYETVRELAHNRYEKHPMRRNMSSDEFNMVFAKSYTYPLLMKSRKRRFLARLFKALSFKVYLPGVEWSKKIGSRAIGASFGLNIRNGVRLQLKPLSGFFEVDIDNEAYVQGLVGFMNWEFDIFRAKACYRGDISYNLNILKDFGINDISQLATIFDKIHDNVVDPIRKTIEAFQKVMEFVKDGGLRNLISKLVDVVKGLPRKLKEIFENIIKFAKIVSDYGKLPWIEAVKKVIYRVKHFVEDVKGDIVDFYNSVVDAVTVTLPFAIQRILDAIEDIVTMVQQLSVNPKEAISTIIRAVINIKTSIAMLIGAKQQIQENCFFLNGQKPYWMNPGDELFYLVNEINATFVEVSAVSKRIRSSKTGLHGKQVGLNDGILTQEEQEAEIVSRFLQILKDTLNPLDELAELGDPFVEAYTSVFDAIRSIKNSYMELKTVVDKTRSLIRKAFGPKFNAQFPTRRVDPDVHRCADGVFGSKSINGLKGIDVEAPRDGKIVSPVVGCVKRKNNHEVVIYPEDANFKKYEIIISNILPHENITNDGVTLGEGEVIGFSMKSECNLKFIHLVTRKLSKTAKWKHKKDDDDYKYVDPTPFVERLVPFPRWTEHCNELSFEFIGQTVAKKRFGLPKKLLKKAKKAWKRRKNKSRSKNTKKPKTSNFFKSISGKLKSKVSKKISSFKKLAKNGVEDLMKKAKTNLEETIEEEKKSTVEILTTMGKLKNFKDNAMSSKNDRRPPNILDAFNVNKFTLAKISKILEDGGQLDTKMRLMDLVAEFSATLQDQPIQHPMTFSPSKLRSMLRAKKTEPRGSFEQMVLQLLSLKANECPLFANRINTDDGTFCKPRSDCLGLTCGVVFQYNYFQKVVKLDITYNACANKLQLTLGDSVQSFNLLSLVHISEFDFPVGGFGDMTARGAIEILNMEDIVVSLHVQLCSLYYPTCAKVHRIFDRIRFPKQTSSYCVSGPKADWASQQVLNMNLEDFAYNVLEAGVGDRKSLLDLLNDLRADTLEALMSNPDVFRKNLSDAFPATEDFCMTALDFSREKDLSFFKNEPSFTFWLGPVGLKFAFGAGGVLGISAELKACFASNTAHGMVTPSVGAKVWGSVSLNIIIAEAGMELTGYLLTVKFPVTVTLKYDKFPLDTRFQIHLKLIPIRLVLSAYLELNFFIFKTRFSITIFDLSCPSINRVILDKSRVKKCPAPPEIRGCTVTQMTNREPTDPAFMLEVSASDKTSDVKRRFAIGTHVGGTNILSWTDMGGASVVIPMVMEHGIPLYWTVKVRNSQGLESTAQCSLKTYDMTLPNGRVDASYEFSSHPHKLSATVFVHDDSPLEPIQYKAVGVGRGPFGNTIRDWEPFKPSAITQNDDMSNELKHFGYPRRGRLDSEAFRTFKAFSDRICAAECIKFETKCISFDYNPQSEQCLLQNTIDGEFSKLTHSGAFHNYQRLIGHSHMFEYDDLPLSHSQEYFINVHITNELGYESYLSSKGTVVDFTPPEPGPIANASLDILRHDGCNASVTQRCTELTWHPNHRVIKDGIGSSTILNGHEKTVDLEYTMSNNYISGHWDGFEDKETGIWGYTWAAGTSVCGEDVSPYDDPHKHLSDSSYWTHNGMTSGLHLKDGQYFVTVQAINNVVFGGALVTTVCHSKPVVIDTVKPEVHSVGSYFYDEEFDTLFLYYNVSDHLSGVSRVDFGLGHTKYDVNVRGYSPYVHKSNEKTHIVIKNLGLKDGVPAWIRLRAIDNVLLFAASHSEVPLLKDSTKPEVGKVLDGVDLHINRKYQADNATLCAHWVDFFDPDTGINEFLIGFSADKDSDSALAIYSVSHLTKSYCYSGHLEHNQTYYATVIAVNRGLKPKQSKASSDGVLIDITPPEKGWIKDGKEAGKDIAYTHKQSEITAHFEGFKDLESDIAQYIVNVYVNKEFRKSFANGLSTKFEEHSMALENGDRVNIEVGAKNGAGSITKVKSDGYAVDLSPPILILLVDSENGLLYQTQDDSIFAKWKFEDSESGVAQYRVSVFMDYQGHKSKIWPVQKDDIVLPSGGLEPMNTTMSMELIDGARYTVKVTAINHAQLSTTHESDGVRVDTTAPEMDSVIVGLSLDEEVVNDNGQVEHLEQNRILASWHGHDDHSGIVSYQVAVGVNEGDDSISGGFRDFGVAMHGHISGLDLQPWSISHVLYYVTVKSVNGAGLVSDPISSKPIFVVKDNVPGVIFDGRNFGMDDNYQHDLSSFAINFHGFESEACGIVAYEWAIGSEPGFSDIQGFSTYGIVMENETSGIAQSNIRLSTNHVYYGTVRAITGHGCPEEFIVSSSDGVIVDAEPPQITVNVHEKTAIYLQYFDTSLYSWNCTDKESDVAHQIWHYGSLPGKRDFQAETVAVNMLLPTGDLSINNSQTGFLTVEAMDAAGNLAEKTWPPLTIDATEPKIISLSCNDYISPLESLITCEWAVDEHESFISELAVGVGEQEGFDNLIQFSPSSAINNKRTFNMHHVLETSTLTSVYVTLNVSNYLHQFTWLSAEVKVDNIPPDGGTVQIVSGKREDETPCQISMTEINVQISRFVDRQSGLQRYDVLLGTKPHTEDVLSPTSIGLQDFVSLTPKRPLQPGSRVFVTVRAFDMVGLFSTVVSKPVTVSPLPEFHAFVGSHDQELRYQMSLSSVSVSWTLIGGCSVESLRWGIYRIDGQVVAPMVSVPSPRNVLVNDELNLENTKTYYALVEIVDSLQRTLVAKTNTVTVNIESPKPGVVIDGDEMDLEYQQPLDTLQARWYKFGDDESSNPSQLIVKYEVAVGNDVSTFSGRANIHSFVDVGLSTKYMFTKLDLQAISTRYYVTVLAHSAAGSTVYVSSNGILVGYNNSITAGTVYVNSAQSDILSLKASWSSFRTHIPLLRYDVGLSSSLTSCSCKNLNYSVFDTSPLKSVGLDTVTVFLYLSLKHGAQYFVTVVAHDVADHCLLVQSSPVTIDLTAPSVGNIRIDGTTVGHISFVPLKSSLYVEWDQFSDTESGIAYYDVSVYKQNECSDRTFHESQLLNIASPVRISRDNATLFEGLSLQQSTIYYVMVEVTNIAGLSSTGWSVPVKVDNSPPVGGSIKYGSEWTDSLLFQTSLHSIDTMVAIDHGIKQTDCKTDIRVDLVVGNTVSNAINILGKDEDFTGKYAFYNSENTYPGDNGSLVLVAETIDEGKAMSLAGFQLFTTIFEGAYTTVFKAAEGSEVITTFYVSSNEKFMPFYSFVFENTSHATYNTTGTSVSNATDLQRSNTTVNIQGNHSATEEEMVHLQPAVGFHVIGGKRNGKFPALFWGVGVDNSIMKEWVTLEHNPFENSMKYSIVFDKDASTGFERWNTRLMISSEEVATLYGIKQVKSANVGFRVWNRNDYFPDLKRTNAIVEEVSLALERDEPCMFGKAFHDEASNIKELWIGLSSQANVSCDVYPLSLVKTPCATCKSTCDLTCDPSCSLKGFIVHHFSLVDLTLSPGSMKLLPPESRSAMDKNEYYFQPNIYYLVVKAVDFASRSVIVVGDGLRVDTTPPTCTQVLCLDPKGSTAEPTEYLGSKEGIGAYWECEDVESDVSTYVLSVGSEEGLDDIVTRESVGTVKEFVFERNKFKKDFFHGKRYWFNVDAINVLGLSSRSSCNVTTDFEPPDIEVISIELPNTRTIKGLPEGVLITDFMTTTGIGWKIKTKTSASIEWGIGSHNDVSDILPTILAGSETSSGVEIADGTLHYVGMNQTLSLSVVPKGNSTTETEDAGDTFFRMEPGRCTYQKLTALSRAKVKLDIATREVCVARKSDIIRKLEVEKPTIMNLEQPSSELSAKTLPPIAIEITGNTSVIAGTLNKLDVKARYGSAASVTFQQYIQDPETSREETMSSRRLKSRFEDYTGSSFFISPIEDHAMLSHPIDVSVPFDREALREGQIPALMFYDPDDTEWKELCESCNSCDDFNLGKDVIWTKTTVVGQLCDTRPTRKPRQAFRKKRELTEQVMYPTQIAMVALQESLKETNCSWTTCEEKGRNNAEERVRCSINEDRMYARESTDGQVTFLCRLVGGKVGSVDILYRPRTANRRFSRLFMHEEDSMSMLSQPKCYTDIDGSETVIRLTVGNTASRGCNTLTHVAGNPNVFKFYMIRHFGQLTGSDAMFVVNCGGGGTEECLSEVPSSIQRAKQPGYSAYVARSSEPQDPVTTARQDEKIVIVLTLLKSSIANGITAVELWAKQNDTAFTTGLMRDSCPLLSETNRTFWPRSDGFSKFEEDEGFFKAISPPFNASTVGVVMPGSRQDIVYSLTLKICTRNDDSFCIKNVCGSKAEADLLQDDFHISVPFIIEGDVDHTTLIVILSVVFATLLTALTVFFILHRRAKQRSKVQDIPRDAIVHVRPYAVEIPTFNVVKPYLNKVGPLYEDETKA